MTGRGARETGLCPIREDLYSQCLDELIRQITINCSHRGLLLVRVRDEWKMNLHCYQKLYESAMAYGIRKSLIITNAKQKMNDEINQLNEDIYQEEQEVADLETLIGDLVEENETEQEKESREHEEEVTNLKKKNQRLKDEMEKKLTVVE